MCECAMLTPKGLAVFYRDDTRHSEFAVAVAKSNAIHDCAHLKTQ